MCSATGRPSSPRSGIAGKSKQRLYRRQDVENLLVIKTLLHDEGYTISGARKLLKNMRRHEQLELPLVRAANQPKAEDDISSNGIKQKNCRPSSGGSGCKGRHPPK